MECSLGLSDVHIATKWGHHFGFLRRLPGTTALWTWVHLNLFTGRNTTLEFQNRDKHTVWVWGRHTLTAIVPHSCRNMPACAGWSLTFPLWMPLTQHQHSRDTGVKAISELGLCRNLLGISVLRSLSIVPESVLHWHTTKLTYTHYNDCGPRNCLITDTFWILLHPLISYYHTYFIFWI